MAPAINREVAMFLPENLIHAGTGMAQEAALVGITRFVGRAVKAINLPSWRRVAINMDHVLSGHTAGGSRLGASSDKDLFPANMSAEQIERAIRTAYRYGEKVASQGSRVLMQGEASGLTIEMWVNKATKTIETAYPKVP
jgi:hypothetical protein